MTFGASSYCCIYGGGLVIGQCIFCLEERELTDEHIIPKSMGGSLTIRAVCIECNSRIGSEIDGKYADSLLVSLPRFACRIKGKTDSIPNPFRSMGTNQHGKKVRLDDDLKPHSVVPTLKEECSSDGHVSLEVVCDKDEAPAVIRKKLQRSMHRHCPAMSEADIDAKVESMVEEAMSAAQVTSEPQEIHYEFKVDIHAMALEYIKIAYETAFSLFGYEYVNNSETAMLLREAINQRQCSPPIHGAVPFPPEKLPYAFSESGCHFIVMLSGAAHITLFGMPGMIQFEEDDDRFIRAEDNATVLTFDYIQRKYRTEKFVDRVKRMPS